MAGYAQVRSFLRPGELVGEFGVEPYEETWDLENDAALIQPGSMIGDSLRVVEVLGRGGFGQVYRVTDPEGREAAAKTPLRESLRQADHMEMFRKEIHRWILLPNHPNVVQAYYLFDFMKRPFVVMEFFADARSLADLMRNGPGGWEMALAVGAQIANGLDFAYRSAQLVHNDIKPGNILVGSGQVAKITDFGISTNPLADESSLFATRAYAAPERLAGSEPTPQSDVYSFGVTLFETATGSLGPDRTSGSPADAQVERLNKKTLRATGTPEPLSDLIVACMAYRARGRPRSMQELLERLEALHRELLESDPVQPPVPTMSEVDRLLNLSSTLNQVGDADRALEAAEQAIHVDPGSPDCWLALANAQQAQGRLDEAIQSLLHAESLEPDRLKPAVNLAYFHARRGDSESAMRWLQVALGRAEEGGKLAQLGVVTGVATDLLGPEAGLDLCDRIIAEDPHAAMVWNNRAVTLRRMGRLNEALASVTQALYLNPGYAKAWNNRANILLQLRQHDEASNYARVACRLDPSLEGPYVVIAGALMGMGRKQEAEQFLRRGLEQAIGTDRIRKALEHLY